MTQSGFRRLVIAAVLALAPVFSPAIAQTIRNVPESNASVARANNAALVHFKKGDYQRTLSALDDIIRRHPNSALAYSNRGAVYFQLKKYDEAIKDYTQAIGLGQNDSVTVLNRASAYSKNGEFDRALDDCNAFASIRAMRSPTGSAAWPIRARATSSGLSPI